MTQPHPDNTGSGHEKSEGPEPSMFMTFLRVWLPFPLILAAILAIQFSRGDLKPAAPPEGEVPAMPASETAETSEEPAPIPVLADASGQDLPTLMQTLTAEREAVNQQRRDLEFAQKRILLEQKEIVARQEEVEKLLQRVESRFGKMEGDRTAMLSQLARVYETMKASTAAEIVAGLDVEMATEVLRRMKEKKAAEIMAKLPPEAAGRISKEMLR
jgi:flagellar motility protein MotE (MotC chaperone)